MCFMYDGNINSSLILVAENYILDVSRKMSFGADLLMMEQKL